MGWNDIQEGGGGDFLKFKAGVKVRLHVLLGEGEEPYTHFGIYNKAIKKGARVPEDYVPTGSLKKSKKHAVNVFDYTDNSVKVWVMSNTAAMELKNLFEQNGSLENHDIIVKRTGAELETKYSIQPALDGCQFDPSLIEGVTLPDLATILAPESDEVIANVEAGVDPGTEFPPAEDEPAAAPAEDAPAEDAPAEEPAEPEAPEEEQPAAPPARKPAPPAKPAPGKPAPAKPAAPGKAAAPAPAASAADAAKKANLIKVILQKKATKAKYKDAKAWAAVLLAATKTAQNPKGKSVLSALTIQELTKLDSLLK